MTKTQIMQPTSKLARHAITCNDCKPRVAAITNSPGHLERLEAFAAIEWCAGRKFLRRYHA